MYVPNQKYPGHKKEDSNDTLSPFAVILVIVSIIGAFILFQLARSFLLENGIIIFGLIIAVVGSLTLTQEQ
ncbi:MAG: hypothetical protein GY796_23110 [Chloroflexi bacterium]|nr:hypothetical protein [Chloroflexota bacterium]